MIKLQGMMALPVLIIILPFIVFVFAYIFSTLVNILFSKFRKEKIIIVKPFLIAMLLTAIVFILAIYKLWAFDGPWIN